MTECMNGNGDKGGFCCTMYKQIGGLKLSQWSSIKWVSANGSDETCINKDHIHVESNTTKCNNIFESFYPYFMP